MQNVRKHIFSDVDEALDWNAAPEDETRRYEWFCQLSDSGRFMFHGSSRGYLQRLVTDRESGDQNEFGMREQVFATPDIFWAMWFALLDRSRILSTANSCFIDRSKQCSYYTFTIDAASYQRTPSPLQSGWIYVLSPETFTTSNQEVKYRGMSLAEYGSDVPVVPLGKIAVHPHDFPYLGSIYPSEAQ